MDPINLPSHLLRTSQLLPPTNSKPGESHRVNFLKWILIRRVQASLECMRLTARPPAALCPWGHACLPRAHAMVDATTGTCRSAEVAPRTGEGSGLTSKSQPSPAPASCETGACSSASLASVSPSVKQSRRNCPRALVCKMRELKCAKW